MHDLIFDSPQNILSDEFLQLNHEQIWLKRITSGYTSLQRDETLVDKFECSIQIYDVILLIKTLSSSEPQIKNLLKLWVKLSKKNEAFNPFKFCFLMP